jgi:hypothetical protein
LFHPFLANGTRGIGIGGYPPCSIAPKRCWVNKTLRPLLLLPYQRTCDHTIDQCPWRSCILDLRYQTSSINVPLLKCKRFTAAAHPMVPYLRTHTPGRHLAPPNYPRIVTALIGVPKR